MIHLLGSTYRPYIEFLRLVATYHHGVFCLPMIRDKRERALLYRWTLRHPEMVRKFDGATTDIILFILTLEFYKEFECAGKPTKGDSYENAMDLCLLNSFIYERKIEETYVNIPNTTIKHEDKKVGIASRRWGINPKLGTGDLLLMTKHFKKECVENLDLQYKYYNGRLSKKKFHELIVNSYCPKALRNIKFSWRS